MYDIIVGRSETDRKKFGMAGTILLGKHYVKMGRTTSLSNSIYLDVARSHVVFICGKRGGGKCLEGDTLITLEDGSQIPIRELENVNKKILCLNQDLKVIKADKSEFFKREVAKMLKIRLRTGKEIKLTPEHPLFTVSGWIRASDLKLGSRIATPRIIDAFGDLHMDEHRVKILAYLISEGHLSNKFVLFSNSDEKIIREFKECIHSFDKDLKVNDHSKYNYRVVSSKKKDTSNAKRDDKGKFYKGNRFDTKSSLKKWLEDVNLYGKLSANKFVPDEIFNIPKQKLSIFLNRLFSCDGTIYFDKSTGTWRISYASISQKLIWQVHHLLLKFGIVSIIRKKTHGFEIELRGENIHKYLSEIGFFGIKEKRAQKAIKESIKITRNPNVDTVPKEIWGISSPQNWADIGRKIGYAHPKALRESIRYSASRQKLLTIAKTDENDLLLKFAESDIYWDEIVYMEEIQGNFTVYDICVPEHHNFVANDIIVHNSYTMGVVAEGMADLEPDIKQNLSFILLDTMGIYWTMKYPNKKDEDLLDMWGLKSKGLDVKIYTPEKYYHDYKSKGIPTDFPFTLNPSELDSTDWQMTFDFGPNEPLGVLIESVVNRLREEKGKSYGMDDIRKAIEENQNADRNTKDALINRLVSTESWGVFSDHGTPISELAQGGQVTVLDVSCYATMPGGWKIKALIVGLVSQKLFIHRMIERKTEEFQEVNQTVHYFTEDDKSKQKMEMPLVWLVLDEAHEFLPREGKNPATDPLITIMREGRQPGISLILATQQPGKIHTDVMTQSDTVISHRLTAKIDVDALSMLMQSYMREGLNVQLDNLPRETGAAVIFDDSNEKMYAMRVRPRFTWHGGESPVAVHKRKEEL